MGSSRTLNDDTRKRFRSAINWKFQTGEMGYVDITSKTKIPSSMKKHSLSIPLCFLFISPAQNWSKRETCRIGLTVRSSIVTRYPLFCMFVFLWLLVYCFSFYCFVSHCNDVVSRQMSGVLYRPTINGTNHLVGSGRSHPGPRCTFWTTESRYLFCIRPHGAYFGSADEKSVAGERPWLTFPVPLFAVCEHTHLLWSSYGWLEHNDTWPDWPDGRLHSFPFMFKQFGHTAQTTCFLLTSLKEEMPFF